jgi:hypothetical protein
VSEDNSEIGANNKMDENYYDLDDDFIDDGDLEMQEEDNYLYNDADTSKYQSEKNGNEGGGDEEEDDGSEDNEKTDEQKQKDRKY